MRRANFYTETRTRKPRCDFPTVRRAGVPGLEGGDGGGARAAEAAPLRGASGPRPDLLGAGPRAAAPGPPRLPSVHSKRMNQPRPGAQPPRFLFSFSTPPAPGAAGLHRRGFPGTLPLTPLAASGAARPLLGSLAHRFRIAKPCPRPLPHCLSPERLAVAAARTARRPSL